MDNNIDLKHEDEFLLKCSLTQIKDADIRNIKHMISNGLNEDYLINLAFKHSLNSLLYCS